MIPRAPPPPPPPPLAPPAAVLGDSLGFDAGEMPVCREKDGAVEELFF